MMKFSKLKITHGRVSATFNLRRELWLLTYATNAFKLVHKLCDIAMSDSCQEGDTTYTGLINAIYVAYGRPFTSSWGIGRLTREDVPIILLPLHEEMIDLRDKHFAHKDLNSRQVEKESFNEVRAVVMDGQISMVSNELLPRRSKIIDIKSLAHKLSGNFDTKSQKIIQRLEESGAPLPNGEYIINLDPTSDKIFLATNRTFRTDLIESQKSHLQQKQLQER